MKKVISTIFLIIIFAGSFIASSYTFSQTVSAGYCCPGETGCSGTCQGIRTGGSGCGCYLSCESSCGGGGGGGGNSCTAAAPTAPTLSLPANLAVDVPKPFTFKWTNNSFGNGCPSTNTTYFYYKIKDTDCKTKGNTPILIKGPSGIRPYVLPVRSGETIIYSQPYQLSPNPAGVAVETSHVLNSALEWGTTYCWKVQENNRASATNSAPREFTTTKIPTYVNGGIGADVCKNNAIGKYDSTGASGTTNPVEWSMTFNNPEPTNNIEWEGLSFMRDSAAAKDFLDYPVLLANAASSGGFTFSVSNVKSAYVYSTYKNSPAAWINASFAATSLDSANANATLSDLRTVTKMTTTGAQTTTNFKVKINSMTTGTYAVYAIAMTRNGTTIIGSSDATASSLQRARKVGTVIVDLVPPSVSVSNPSYLTDGSGTYNITWNASDTFLKNIYSYIYSDTVGSTLHDNTLGQDIVTGNTELSFPDTSNAGVTLNSLGTRNYKDMSPDSNSVYNYKLHVTDSACNVAEGSNISQPVTPWILGTNGDISSYISIEKTRVPDIPNFIIPFTSTTGSSFFSEYSSISGSGVNAKGKTSKHSDFVNNYFDDAAISTHDSNGSWYVELLDKVTKNGKTTVNPITSRIVSGDLASGLGTTANSKYGAEISGDLTINSNTTCNLRAIIFVNGNLIINPDFTIAAAPNTPIITDQVYNGCLFIVKGNTTIQTGSTKTNLPSTSTTLASYDIVEAYILTDGTLSIPTDTQANGQKEDGIFINGGAYAKSTMNGAVSSIKRDLKFEANNLQPAMFFNLDPRYKLMFSEDFASRDYEIREFGL